MAKESRNGRNKVLVAGMAIQLCAGIIYMWSVFKSPVTDYLQWDSGSANLVTSIMMMAFVIGMIVGGFLVKMFGTRKSSLIGSIVMSGGILLTTLVDSSMPSMIFITYAIVGGLGVGIVYTCTVATVQSWFFDRRGFATGMMVGAFGFSMVVFAPLAEYLLDSFDVPKTFLIFGITFLVICAACSMFMADPPEGYKVSKGDAVVEVAKAQKQYTAKEMMHTRAFYLIFLSMFFVIPAFFMLNPLLKTLAVDRGLEGFWATSSVMVVGLFSATGRLSITWLSDRIGRMGSLIMINVMTAVSILVLIFATGALFLVFLAMVAMAFGGVSGVFATITSDHFGTKNMGVNYGIMSLAMGFSSVVFTCVNNVLSGSGGDYTASFIVAAATCVVSILLVLVLRRESMPSAAPRSG